MSVKKRSFTAAIAAATICLTGLLAVPAAQANGGGSTPGHVVPRPSTPPVTHGGAHRCTWVPVLGQMHAFCN
jgi:hypothetical protein